MKKNKSIFAIILLLTVFLVGSTIAYFTSTGVFSNIFTTAPYHAEFPLDVEVSSNWLPGETEEAIVNVKNSSSLATAVRLSYTEQWTANDGTTLSNTLGAENVALINMVNKDEWIKKGDYYYYQKILNSGETSSNFIESVTLNPLLESTYTCIETSENTTSCTSSGNGYDNATYKINITVELLQADAVEEVWNTTIG